MLSRIEFAETLPLENILAAETGNAFQETFENLAKGIRSFQCLFPRINLPQFVNYEFYNLLLVKFEM